tara:strand:+ start:548 stop:658 length:111 start_codon:yes stop_codon:yes gene_type:complete
MNNLIKKDDHELINKITLIINDFENFEKPLLITEVI